MLLDLLDYMPVVAVVVSGLVVEHLQVVLAVVEEKTRKVLIIQDQVLVDLLLTQVQDKEEHMVLSLSDTQSN